MPFVIAPRKIEHAANVRWHCVLGFPAAVFLFSGLILLVFGVAGSAQSSQEHLQKLPKPRQLDKGIQWHRDLATGELRMESPIPEEDEISGAVPAAPRVLVGPVTRLVPITCSVFASDGTPLRDLQPQNFRVYDDGVERPILIFDGPSAQPARVALVIDASPSVLRDSAAMKKAAGTLVEGLAPADEVAIVDFSAHTYLQSGFTGVRELLRRAVNRVDVREL